MSLVVGFYITIIILLFLVNWLAIFGRLSIFFYLFIGFYAINIDGGLWYKIIGIILTLLIAYYLVNINEKFKSSSAYTPLAHTGGISLSAYFWGCFLGICYFLVNYFFLN